MSVEERILALELIRESEKRPELFKELGITAELKVVSQKHSTDNKEEKE